MTHTTLCQNLIDLLHNVGYTDELIKILIQSPQLLKQLLPIIAAQAPVQAPGIETKIVHDDLLVHEVLFSPLALDVRGWGNYIAAKNKGLPADRQATVHNPESFYLDSNFEKSAILVNSKMVLIDTNQGALHIDDACAIAETSVQSAASATQPWLIFEVLRTFWDHLSEINAAYVMVGVKAVNGLFPVLFNSTAGKRLGFINGAPKNNTYSGYIAYCGSVK